jgi:hypothetical protein
MAQLKEVNSQAVTMTMTMPQKTMGLLLLLPSPEQVSKLDSSPLINTQTHQHHCYSCKTVKTPPTHTSYTNPRKANLANFPAEKQGHTTMPAFTSQEKKNFLKLWKVLK